MYLGAAALASKDTYECDLVQLSSYSIASILATSRTLSPHDDVTQIEQRVTGQCMYYVVYGRLPGSNFLAALD